MLRSPAILSDPAFVAANQNYMGELQPVIEPMRENLPPELKNDFAQNPPKPRCAS